MPRKPKYLTGEPYLDDEDMYNELDFLRPAPVDQGPNPWSNENQFNHMVNHNKENYPSWNWGQITDNAKDIKSGFDYAMTPYDDDDEYLKDEHGRYFYEKKRGLPDDKNYFNNPFNRKTLNKIKKNWLSDLMYNKIGSRKDVYINPHLDPKGGSNSAIQLNPDFMKRHFPNQMSNPNEIYGRDGIEYGPYFPNPNSYDRPLTNIHSQTIGTVTSKSQPKVKMEGSNMVFSNCEYVMDIGASMTSKCDLTKSGFYKVQCNIGLPLFSVGSQLGQAFTLYRFRKLKFLFYSTSSSSLSTTNSQLGTGIMAYKINTAQPDFQNLYEMQNYGETVVFRPSQNAKIDLDTSKSSTNMYYTRYDKNTITGYSATTEGSASPLLVDQFNFYIGVFNALSANTVGLLYVDYEVEMSQVQLIGAQVGYNILYYRANFLHYPSGLAYEWPYFAFENSLLNLTGGSYHGSLDLTLVDNLDGTAKIVFPPWISTGTYCLTYSVSCQINIPDISGFYGLTLWNGIFANCQELSGIYTYSGYDQLQTSQVYESAGFSDSNSYPIYLSYANAGGGQLTTGGIFTTYVKITGTNASVPLNLQPTQQSASGITIGNLYGSSLVISQCNPDFNNAFNSGYYINA
jgi:hypothetical protein